MERIILKNEHLKATLLQPGDPVYRRTRFDWTGFMTGVELDGKYTFTVKEQENPERRTTGGEGFCCEYPFDQVINEAAIGERFPKPGVGLLTRPDEKPYHFGRDYEVVPFEKKTEIHEDYAVFVQEPMEALGYAFRETKTVRLEGQSIVTETVLENTGDKELELEEYNHNFVGINHLPIGPDYELDYPGFDFTGKPDCDCIRAQESHITWYTAPTHPFYYELPSPQENDKPYNWKLINTKAGAGVCEKVDAPLGVSRCKLWGVDHVSSCEVMVRIRIPAGESMKWTRTLSFFEI